MVRSPEENVLFNNICKTIVHTGGYRMAWVGLAELNGGLYIRSVSCANQPESQMDLVALTDSHNAEQADPIREVVQTGQMKIIQYDPQKSDRTPWEDAALERGFTASVILPLGSGDRFFGVLSIYTSEPETLDKGEVDLLQELADDITFGVSTLRMRIERNKAEAEKERIQAQLHQSQKMEAVGILAGGIAHDFNNLLTAIQVSADLAMLELPESDSVYNTLQEIHRVASNAGDLAKQMLLFSRKHPMEYAPIRLNQVVTDLQKMLRRLIGEDIEIETRLDAALWNVMADKGTMEQVVMNLAINARDAMPKGGRLIIQTENEDIKGKSVQSDSDARCGKFVKLTVQDNGMGMDKEILSHIFEPFFSTKSPGKGTGLGLSVVYGIIKQHEGWITTSSAPGEGSTFEIYLPASIESAVSLSKKKKVTANPCGKGERILIVEDERIVQESTDRALVKSGYSVLSASNGAEALRIFENEGGAFDLVFSDVVLPDRNGIELVETLKSKNPKIKVLLSSGYTDYKAQWPVIIERGFQYLQKPYMMNNLLQTLRKVLDA
jgi:two-component system cell cycle sensor histidine kinase/response regulator CckA